jgi:hypothetical protein
MEILGLGWLWGVGFSRLRNGFGCGSQENIEVAAVLPSLLTSPRWAYVPAILFTLGSAILAVRAIAPLVTKPNITAPETKAKIEIAEHRPTLDWKSSGAVLGLTEQRLLIQRSETLSQLAGVQEKIDTNDAAIRGGATDEFSALHRLLNPPTDLEKKRRELNAEYAGRFGLQDNLYRLSVEDLHEKLRKGELVAQGFLLPVEKDSVVADIPAERWRFLKLNDDFTKASGESLSYAGIAIAKPR